MNRVMMVGTGPDEKPRAVVVSEAGFMPPPFEEYQEHYSAALETNVEIWRPSAGRCIVLLGIVASSLAAIRYNIEVRLPSGALYRDIRVFVTQIAPATVYAGGWKLPRDAYITYSTSAATDHYIAVYGRIEG